jgi:hypothetical protein
MTAAPAISLLVVSIAAIGATPFSYQQASERRDPRLTSANIVNREVRNQDFASDSVACDNGC